MEHKQKTGYLGSLYWLTRDARLKEHPDTVEYWKIPGTYKTTVNNKGSDKALRGSIYAEGASGVDVYKRQRLSASAIPILLIVRMPDVVTFRVIHFFSPSR